MNLFKKKQKCFLCPNTFKKKGGVIRFESDEGLQERLICEDCAAMIERNHEALREKYEPREEG